MVIYLITFIISLFLIMCTEKYKLHSGTKKVFVFIALLLPALLAGLRSYEIGSDTSGYGTYWFEQATRFNNWLDFIKYAKGYSIDYGYATLNYLASRLGNDAHIFFFLLCFLELSLLYYTAKRYSKNGTVALTFLFYYFMYYNDSLNNMRQFPAVLIIVYAYRFIEESKLLPFVGCVVLASTFHVTAIFAVVLYPIAWMAQNKFSKLNLLLIVVGILVACFSIDEVFKLFVGFGLNLTRYEHYIYGADGGGKFVRLGIFGIIWIVYFMNKDKYATQKGIAESNVFFFFCTISLAFTSLMFLGITNYIIRLSYYFDFFLLLYLPSVLKLHTTFAVKKDGTKIGLQYFIVVISLVTYWTITYVVRNGADTVPYKFFWS